MITVCDELHQVGAAHVVPLATAVLSGVSAVPHLEPDQWGQILGRYAEQARRQGDMHNLPIPASVIKLLNAHRREGETDEVLVRRLLRMA